MLAAPQETNALRKPETIERLYLDFDGFFASVEQQADRRLRGRPVGVVPFEGTDRTCVIACSREAKAYGVRNVMPVGEAREACPDIVLVPQKPDLYRRAHNTLIAEISSVIPVDAVKSIDELTCRLDESGRRDPELLVTRLKSTLEKNVGKFITASVGIAANLTVSSAPPWEQAIERSYSRQCLLSETSRVNMFASRPLNGVGVPRSADGQSHSARCPPSGLHPAASPLFTGCSCPAAL